MSEPWDPRELTPLRIVEQFSQDIVGQENAKQKVARAIWWNQYRTMLIAGGHDPHSLPDKQNILLTGPTGTGKTLLARAAAAVFDVPFFATSATSYSSAGYTGLHTDDMIGGLVQTAGGDVARSQRGIILLDEVDKLRTRDFGGHDDVGCRAVQQSWLTMLAGDNILIKKNGDEKQPVDTTGITFIAAGTFAGLQETVQRRIHRGYDIENGPPPDEEWYRHIAAEDLVDFGFIPEFISRFPVRVGLVPLTREQLRQVLRESRRSSMRQLIHLYRLHGIDLQFDEGAITTLVDLAEQEGTGARALVEIMLDRLSCLLAMLPDLLGRGIKRVVVEAATILDQQEPLLVPGDPEFPPIDVGQLVGQAGTPAAATPASGLLPGITNTRGWTDKQVRERLEAVKAKLDWANTTGSARKWWDKFEEENAHRLALVLRLAEELANRKATIVEFFLAYVYSNTDNIQANLYFLDYTRLKKEEEKRKREAAEKARAEAQARAEAEARARAEETAPAAPRMLPARFRSGDTCPDEGAGRYVFDGYLDNQPEPAVAPAEPIDIHPGEVFPKVAQEERPCWWRRLEQASTC